MAVTWKKLAFADDVDVSLSGKQPYHGIESIGALSFDNTEHILTIATGVTYWITGVQRVNTGSTTCDIDTDNSLTSRTLYWFYFEDTSGTLKCGTSINLLTQSPVATVYWNGSAGAIQREYHSYKRSVTQHILDHMTVGCRYKNDGGFAQTAPTTAADGTLQIEIGTLYDEDLAYTTGQLTTMRCWHKYNASSYTFTDYSLPYPGGGAGDPYFLDIADYALKATDDAKFVCYWVYGSLDNDRPLYVFTQPIAAPYNTIALARAEAVPNLVTLGINPEIKLLYRWIYRGDGQYQEGNDYRTSSPVPSGAVQSISASSVTSNAHGTTAATNVQAAIEELTDEKAGTAVASTTAAGLAPQATAPAAGLRNVLAIDNGETAYSNKALFDATVPEDLDYSDVASAGTAMASARRDHVHGMPAAGGIADESITNTKLAHIATSTIKGRVAAGTGDVEDLSAANVRTIINVADGANVGLTDIVGDTTPQLGGFLDMNKKYISMTTGLSDQEFCGITCEGTGGATAIAFGTLCYFKASDSLWYPAKADVTATSGIVKLGMCVLAGTSAATRMLLYGNIRANSLFPSFSPLSGQVYVSAASAGEVTSTAPTGTTNFVVRCVGRANTADELFFNPSEDYVELA